jgi:RNA polymerase sigma-70 factor (ECF subfamily)
MNQSVLAQETAEEDYFPNASEQPSEVALAWADHENRELVRQVAEHSTEALAAFTFLYQQYQPPVFAFCSRFLVDRGHAEDVTQEVLYTMWKNAATYQGHAQVKTWVLGIAHNLCRNVWRKAMHREECHLELINDTSRDVHSATRTISLAPFHSDSLGRCPDASASCEAKDQHQLLREGLSKLSPAQRTVLHLAYFEGFSIREIAQVLEICAGTVKSRMANARRLLRHHLERAGIR